MKKITSDMFTNPNVEAFLIFKGSFNPFYLTINKGAPLEKRIASIFKPDGYAWAEDVAYQCDVIVIPQSKKAYDAFIAHFVSDVRWARRLEDYYVQVLPYERSSFQKMKGGMYYCPDRAGGNRWAHSFTTFSFGAYCDGNYISFSFFDEDLPQYPRVLMSRVESACSHLKENQEERVKELYATLWNIYGEGYGEDISKILG